VKKFVLVVVVAALAAIGVRATDSINSRVIGSCSTPEASIDVTVSGDYVYVAAVGAAGAAVPDTSCRIIANHSGTVTHQWESGVDHYYLDSGDVKPQRFCHT
jgi:hypothetical protein